MGTITQVFTSHITLLLLGLFNVIIYAEDISNKIFLLDKDGEWMDGRTTRPIDAGDEVFFEVKEFEVRDESDFSIVGEMMNSKRTGLVENIKNGESIKEQFEQIKNEIA